MTRIVIGCPGQISCHIKSLTFWGPYDSLVQEVIFHWKEQQPFQSCSTQGSLLSMLEIILIDLYRFSFGNKLEKLQLKCFYLRVQDVWG